MPDFDNNGANIHYELMGAGPPLLMIAGIASDGASWGPLTPLLAERFRLILVDNRGAGRTRCEGPLRLADMAGDCAALLDHLGVLKADVVGHSLGGYLGLLLAQNHPTRVRRLVTMCAAGLTPKVRMLFEDLARVYSTSVPEDWFRLLYQWLFSEPFFADQRNVAAAADASAAYPWRQSPGDFGRQVAALATVPPVSLASLGCPVLALAAGRDLIVSPAAVAALHAAIAQHSVDVIPDAAHSIHWEAPEAVAKAIRNFLR
jgi:aminoacrylate hydrolase